MSTLVNNRFQSFTMKHQAPKLNKLLNFVINKPGPPKRIIQVQYDDYSKMKNDQFVWFGHSTIMLKVADKVILVDPTFFSIVGTKHFKYTQQLDFSSLPTIDYLLITHNHYDHLCIKSIKQIASKVQKVILPLQNKQFLKKIFKDSQMSELDWFESIIQDNLTIKLLPSKHYSARGMCDKNKSLWGSYQVNDVFLSSDSGFSPDLVQKVSKSLTVKPKIAFVECGQYNLDWHDNHLLPEETNDFFNVLGAEVMVPIHFGKFCLSLHQWNEPVQELNKICDKMFVGQIGKIYDFTFVLGQKKFIDPVWDVALK
ncbi:Beta-lactamase_superfamily domain-containing protein [Hexamita inflata]|uniref:Beta-lactamase superfamily domain-containing protein n=1 Tax=Hexamita inflata TaxID=28002 RepID=A0AA86P768_9EUKA|nr:Beta-lactamase superfamily domain-containing protein [Hexamita inflata]